MIDGTGRELPQFRAWSESFEPPAGVDSFLARHLTATTASLFMTIVTPPLIEVRGCVLLASRYEPQNFESWWQATDGDVTAIESTLNRVGLGTVLGDVEAMEPAALEDLAERVVQCWRWHAAASFPDRAFDVDIVPHEDDGPTLLLTSVR